ncbi:MAG: 3-isopropylmalate dehydratase small subunit [Chloroflexi bacterium]|nr:3-isopropylmalate dehydratase small subunit [Chloroflexota bacterium]
MEKGRVIKGRVWKFGDNIDTDQIYPTKFCVVSYTKEEVASHAMEASDHPNFAREAKPGDIIVGGRNFGCGSSREYAPVSLKYVGVGAVIAESFARIFYRNAFNIGLLVIEAKGISNINEGDEIEIDMELGEIRDLTTGSRYPAAAVPAGPREVFEKGGLIPYLEARYL